MHDYLHLPFSLRSPIPGERVFVMTSARGKQTAFGCRCYWKEGREGELDYWMQAGILLPLC